MPDTLVVVYRGGEGCTRGSGTGVAGWEGYTGTHPAMPPGSHIDHILRLGPTHGQMKAIQLYSMRFPRYGPELTTFDPRIDLI